MVGKFRVVLTLEEEKTRRPGGEGARTHASKQDGNHC